MSKSIITSLTWIKKGWAKPIPIGYEDNEDTIKEYKKIKEKISDKNGKTIKETTEILESELNDLQLNNYPNFCTELTDYYESNKNKKSEEMEIDDDVDNPEGYDDISEEEEDDFTIHPDDGLIACTTAQDDISNIEVYIFNESTQSLYVHHDIMLSAYPLCIEWLPLNQTKKSNMAVIGSFLPEIEIWNLDVQDSLEPEIILGPTSEEKTEKYYKNLKKKKNRSNTHYIHTDAVMSLNINPFNCGIIASSGADSKILFWDLNSNNVTQGVKGYYEHNDKVQSIRWNKMEDNVLLSGSFDKTLRLYDVRSETSSAIINIKSDIECIDWSSVNKYFFLSSYEDGTIELFDIRKMEALTSFKAHKKAATSVNFSNKKEGLFVSVGSDSYVKIWDIENAEKNPGELFTAKFSDDFDFTIAVGGSTGELFIWQLEENPMFCNRFGIKFEEGKVPDEFNNISKKRMMSNRIGFRKDKKKLNKKNK